MVVDKEHINVYETLHGGFTAAVVDVISSLAVITHPRAIDHIESSPTSGVSVDIHITYVFSYTI